ncbi:MAG: ketopantoate reductase family protein [Oceanobacter sp.]
MKCLVIGAGGLGSFIAAQLVRSARSVVMVSRGLHLDTIASRGLLVNHPQMGFHGPVAAVNIDTLQHRYRCSDFDLVILTAKAADTAGILNNLGLWLQDGEAPVLSLQSGVENEQQISREVGRERTLGGLSLMVKAYVVSPGRIDAAGEPKLEIGAWPNQWDNPYANQSLSLIQSLFNDAGISCHISEDIRQSLWRKLVFNNGINPVSALTFLSTRLLMTDTTLRDVIYNMMLEGVRAAQTAGITLDKEDARDMFELLEDYGDLKSPMLIDRVAGRPLEINEICGPVIQYCERSGKPATWTRLIGSLLKANMSGTSALGKDESESSSQN